MDDFLDFSFFDDPELTDVVPDAGDVDWSAVEAAPVETPDVEPPEPEPAEIATAAPETPVMDAASDVSAQGFTPPEDPTAFLKDVLSKGEDAVRQWKNEWSQPEKNFWERTIAGMLQGAGSSLSAARNQEKAQQFRASENEKDRGLIASQRTVAPSTWTASAKPQSFLGRPVPRGV